MPFDSANTESSVTRNLRMARDVLARGWCAGIRVDERGNHCAIGALEAVGVQLGNYDDCAEINHLAKFAKSDLRGAHCYPATRVAHHNNTFGKEATLQMFDEAIADSVASLLV